MPIIRYHQTSDPYFGVDESGKNKELPELIESILLAPAIELRELDIDLKTEPRPTFLQGIAFEEYEIDPKNFQITESNKEKIEEILRQIAAIMSDSEAIFRHLKDLDQTLGDRLQEQGINEINNRPQYLIAGAGNFIAGPWPENYRPLRKNKILNKELLERENNYGINLDGVGIFDGFIGNDDANQFVNDGHIFSEEEQKSKFLFHGKYTHRLCFEIIRQAAETGELDLEVNGSKLTQKQLLQIITTTWCKKSGISTWGVLNDSAEESNLLIEGTTKIGEDNYRKKSLDPKNYSFSGRSPFVFKSLITCFGGEELPNLSSYLLDSHYKQVAQMIYKIRASDFEGALSQISDETIYTSCIDTMSTGENYRIENILGRFSFLADKKSEKTELFSRDYHRGIRRKTESPKNNFGKTEYESIADYIQKKNGLNSLDLASDDEVIDPDYPNPQALKTSIKSLDDKVQTRMNKSTNDQNR